MYALINTMNAIPGDSLGTIVSLHRSVPAAVRSDAALQRATRRGSGSSSYIPTRVVRLVGSFVGRHVPPALAVRVHYDD